MGSVLSWTPATRASQSGDKGMSLQPPECIGGGALPGGGKRSWSEQINQWGGPGPERARRWGWAWQCRWSRGLRSLGLLLLSLPPRSRPNKFTARGARPQVVRVFRCRPLKDTVGLGFPGEEVLLVVGVVQADLVAAFLHPEGGAVGDPVDGGRRGGVEILGVAHGVAVGVLVVGVSARSQV